MHQELLDTLRNYPEKLEGLYLTQEFYDRAFNVNCLTLKYIPPEFIRPEMYSNVKLWPFMYHLIPEHVKTPEFFDIAIKSNMFATQFIQRYGSN